MSRDILTPGAQRGLELAAKLATFLKRDRVTPPDVLWGLWWSESHAAETLRELGLTEEKLSSLSPDHAVASREMVELQTPGLVISHRIYSPRSVRSAGGELGTGHVLVGLVESAPEIKFFLESIGISHELLLSHLFEQSGIENRPIESGIELRFEESQTAERRATFRLMDAALNRVREGCRVIDDGVRFLRDDPYLTERLKEFRHRFQQHCRLLDQSELILSRDVAHDVGTSIHTEGEYQRGEPRDVIEANFKRIQESLRSLAEYGKLLMVPTYGNRVDREFSAGCDQFRYEIYELEQIWQKANRSENTWGDKSLYLLVSQESCRTGIGPTVKGALSGGASIIQLREKRGHDRRILELGRSIREWTREAGALFIINDRPDLAVLLDADGVHVGQEDLPLREARRIVGNRRIVGVSTHNIEQARQAVREGADYIGVGPTFPSQTKSFETFPGLEFVRQVASELRIPAFAIGGIRQDNLHLVLEAGLGRVAVSNCICQAESPEEAARGFCDLLHRRSSPNSE